jgi:16S rRNA (cytidine1402-2'-O)-methyltransferase
MEVMGPQRRVSVSREISKLHEQTVRGTAEEVRDYFKEHEPKGEIVIILAGKPNDKNTNVEE